MHSPILTELPPPPPGKTGWPWTEESPQLPRLMPNEAPWPRVSVVTPSYNQGQFIEETIRSVLLQGYPDLEYIIMDGGSTDDSTEIIRKYTPWLTYWVSEKDGGQSAAINQGWRIATGDVLAWMNSDDSYLPGAVTQAVEWLVDHPEVGLVFGDCNWIGESGEPIGQPELPAFDYVSFVAECNDYIPSGSVFLRHSTVRRIGGLDESLHMVMDWDYWMRAGLEHSFGQIEQALSYFRVYASAKTWDPKQSAIKAREIVQAYEKLFSRADLPLCIGTVRSSALARAYFSGATYANYGGDYRLFRYFLWKAIVHRPSLLRSMNPRFLGKAILGRQTVAAISKLRRLLTHSSDG